MIDDPRGQRVFRRRKKYQGSTWTPNTASATSQDGVWCPRHKMRHGYKSSTLGVYFDRNDKGGWIALWFCVATGTVLDELELNNVRNV